jgi:protein-S-isoprenylcysteine O-methyltransferase Ste14
VWAIVLYVFLCVWFVLEDVLMSLGRRRGAPAAPMDRATILLLAGVPLAMLVAGVLAATAGGVAALRLPGYPGTGIAGLVAVLAGLAVRTWAVLSPGGLRSGTSEERTLRARRVPGYAGFVLAGIGCGLLSTTWVGLALLTLAPLVAIARRVQVDERRLVPA